MSRQWVCFMLMIGLALTTAAHTSMAGNILINHQGRLTENGTPVPDGSYAITVRIFDQEIGGLELYSETHTASVVDGLYNMSIGSVTPLSTDVLTCDPATSGICPRYLEIQIASDPPMTPRTRLVAGPFSGVANRLQGDIETQPDAIVFSNGAQISAESIIPASNKSDQSSVEVTKVQSPGFVVDLDADGIFELQCYDPFFTLDINDDGNDEVEVQGTQVLFKQPFRIDSDNDGNVECFFDQNGQLFDCDDDGEIDYAFTPTFMSCDKDAIFDPDGDGTNNATISSSGFRVDADSDGLVDFEVTPSQMLTKTPAIVDADNDSEFELLVDPNFIVLQDNTVIDANGDSQNEVQVTGNQIALTGTVIADGNTTVTSGDFNVDADGDSFSDLTVDGSLHEMRVRSDVKIDADSDGDNEVEVDGSLHEMRVHSDFKVDADNDGTSEVSVDNGLITFRWPVTFDADTNGLPEVQIPVSGPTFIASLEVSDDVTVQGNLDVQTDLNVTGTKNFVQDHPHDASKEIVYVSLEGGEAGTYTRGSAQLRDGVARIELPEHFSLVTHTEGLTVQVTPTTAVRGMLYVAEKLHDHIVVKSSHASDSDATFDFVVHGVRDGFEDHQVIRERTVLSRR